MFKGLLGMRLPSNLFVCVHMTKGVNFKSGGVRGVPMSAAIKLSGVSLIMVKAEKISSPV